jgi:hypothetical protein
MNTSWSCVQQETQEAHVIELPELTAPPSGTFEFEGHQIQVSRGDAGWLLFSEGHEVANSHLGTATRILFDPEYHTSTSGLVREILAWASANPRELDQAS